MRVWCVANQKGGVGKTTTAVNLAGLLTRVGRRVLLVDLDPQGSLTSYFGYNPDAVENSFYNLFQDAERSPQQLIIETGIRALSLLPASTAMATLDKKMGVKGGKGVVVRQALQRLAAEYDNIIIDCSPVLGILLVNALAASDFLVIPVQTEHLALKGLERMGVTIAMIERSLGRRLPHIVVPTMYDQRTRASKQAMDDLKQGWGNVLYEDVIPVDTQFRDASRVSLPLTMLNPKSRGARAYLRLIKRVIADDSLQTTSDTA